MITEGLKEFSKEELKQMDIEVETLIKTDLLTNPNTKDLRMAPNNFKTKDTIGVSFEELQASEPDYIDYLEWAEEIVIKKHREQKLKTDTENVKWRSCNRHHLVKDTNTIQKDIADILETKIRSWNPEKDSVNDLKNAFEIFGLPVSEAMDLSSGINEAIIHLEWAEKYYDEYADSPVSDWFCILTIDHEGNCLVGGLIGEEMYVSSIQELEKRFESIMVKN